MVAIANGLSVYGGIIPYTATFLNFIEYVQHICFGNFFFFLVLLCSVSSFRCDGVCVVWVVGMRSPPFVWQRFLTTIKFW